MENWKEIKDYETYQVSDLGRVKNSENKIMKLKTTNNYLTICLSKNSKRKYLKVHRLVAIAFIKNPDKKPFVNHINGVKVDNRVSNLEWCTAKENSQHALKKGLHNPIITKQARQAVIDKCSKETICVDTGQVFKSAYEAAIWLNDTKFNNTKKVPTISAKIRCCRNGTGKTAYGYKFKFNK